MIAATRSDLTRRETDRATLEASGVSFDAFGFKTNGEWYSYTDIDAHHLSQTTLKPQSNPLIWLIGLAALFLMYDLAVANIDGVGIVVGGLALVGILGYLTRMPNTIEVSRTSLVLTMGGRPVEVAWTPTVPFEAFDAFQRELSRSVLIDARTNDEGSI